MQDINQDLPQFLRTVDGFAAHLKDQFEDAPNLEKGDAFAAFALRLLPLCDFWKGHPAPELWPKKTHDKGVDLIARSDDGAVWLCGQSKYRMREVADLDQVISKWRAFERDALVEHAEQTRQVTLPITDPVETRSRGRAGKRSPGAGQRSGGAPLLRFVLVTATDLAGIRQRFESSGLPSKEFYAQLQQERRLEIVDGARLLTVLQSLYRQSFILSPSLQLNLDVPFIRDGNVYLSLLDSHELAKLYHEHGSSLFFENIREFLGSAHPNSSKDSVNAEILDTLRASPSKMLGRNNGVTFKAESVVVVNERSLQLTQCSIVNGCQTTMCVVQAEPSPGSAKVVVKIVAEEDSWGVAKAANYQNNIARIDLELAQHLRPQLVRKAATDVGYGVRPTEEARSISKVLESFYEYKVNYESMKALYLGIFSRFPNNIFNSNYSELRVDTLARFAEEGRSGNLMEVLFRLLQAMKRAAETARARFDGELANLFQRFFNEDKPQYQCLLAILCACGCVGTALTEKPSETEPAYQGLALFIRTLETVLIRHPDYFDHVFRHAFVAIASRLLDTGGEGSASDIQQKMYKEIVNMSGAAFHNLLNKLLLFMRNDDALKRLEPDLGA